VVFVWWGEAGDNGKSTVMNLLKMILGSYCKSASKSLFIKTKSNSKLTPEREVLKDTRMAVFSETAAEDALNDEVLKMASGDDPICINPKYQAEYEFCSYAKLLIASNHKLAINVSDSAMVCRVKFIPFLTKFVDNPKEDHERLKDGALVWQMESDLLDALFTWILDGAIHWYASGLVDIPAVMQKVTKAYLNENDEIGEFLADKTEPVEGQVIPSKGLYKILRVVPWPKCAAKGVEDVFTGYGKAVQERAQEGGSSVCRIEIEGTCGFRGAGDIKSSGFIIFCHLGSVGCTLRG
jgi:P4 family phage/plasmid primase-like protien